MMGKEKKEAKKRKAARGVGFTVEAYGLTARGMVRADGANTTRASDTANTTPL